jgi:hypothetical protein
MRKILTILFILLCLQVQAASYYFRNAGVNWGTAANWSLTDGGGATGAVPLSTDLVYFTTNSGNCTLDASNKVCKAINFTGYTNTITFTNSLTVSGSVILSTGMGFAGSGTLTINAAGGLTTKGKTLTQPLIFTGAIIDSLDCSGGLITNITFNTAGATLILKSGVVIQGKATSTASTVGSPVIINSSIGGTKRSVIFYNDASMDLDFVNFTDVDASNGLTIYTYLGVLSNTINIDNTMNNTIVHSTATPISGN